MKLLDLLRFRIATFFQRSQMNAEMEEELRSHIQHRADDLERSGLSRAESERRARIEFGGREKFKEECHEAIPVVGFFPKTPTASSGKFVELGAAIVLRCAPARFEQSLTDEAKQTGVERALFDQQGIAGDLPDA